MHNKPLERDASTSSAPLSFTLGENEKMIKFPINPTPFVIPYAIIVFVIPWLITAFYFIKFIALAIKNKQFAAIGLSGISIKKIFEARKEFLTNNQEANVLNRKVIKLAISTIVIWVIGFISLGVTLFILESNNLLINHSKGIY